jgi:hypothetical protein
MFELEKSIAEWRKQMLAAGIKTPVPLEELEIHLRENMERQIRSGINEQQAFEVATQQIGKANMLNDEFAKVEEARKARAEKLANITLVAFTNLILWGLCGLMLFKIAGFSQVTSGQQMSWLAATATFSLLVWIGQSSSRMLPVIRDRRIRFLITYSVGVTVLLWMSVFLDLIAPSLDLTSSQLKLMIPWVCFIPGGAYIGLMVGLSIAARKPITTSDQYA